MATTERQALAEFGSLVKKAREARGLTQQEVSEELGISRSYYTHIENGLKNVPILLTIKLCKFFKIDFDAFVLRQL